MRIAFLLTKAPISSRDPEMCLNLALSFLKKNSSVAIYLLTDGVLCARKGQNPEKGVEKLLKKALELGAEVYVRREDLLARGVSAEKMVEKVQNPEDFLGTMVYDVMEKSERVICL
jgi:sulfur relay protein TusB/DsrH